MSGGLAELRTRARCWLRRPCGARHKHRLKTCLESRDKAGPFLRRSAAWPPVISPSFSRRSRISRKTLLNAVYDLCEDQDPNIRIEGYKAIVRMSEEQPRWLERNVDVLVQLLQSDEPEEVAVVEMALKQHLQGHPRRPLRPNQP
ncbi:hypothetical protein EDB83DRAFT_2429423 [Lactarius deliciosus]|nr:hypothetical protein EDB83DRAFT_2429423 [Lactarius deliciosus]